MTNKRVTVFARMKAVGGMVDSCFNESCLDRYEKVKSSLKIDTLVEPPGYVQFYEVRKKVR